MDTIISRSHQVLVQSLLLDVGSWNYFSSLYLLEHVQHFLTKSSSKIVVSDRAYLLPIPEIDVKITSLHMNFPFLVESIDALNTTFFLQLDDFHFRKEKIKEQTTTISGTICLYIRAKKQLSMNLSSISLVPEVSINVKISSSEYDNRIFSIGILLNFLSFVKL